MKNIIILCLAAMTIVPAACSKDEKTFENVIQSVDVYINEVRSGNPVIHNPRNLKFIYDNAGKLAFLQDSLLSGGPPLIQTYMINYLKNGKLQSLMMAGKIIQHYMWLGDNDLTIYLPNTTSPVSKYVIAYNTDGSLKQKEKLSYGNGSSGMEWISEYKTKYYNEKGNIVRIEKYVLGKLSTVDIYTYNDLLNPFYTYAYTDPRSLFPRGLIFIDSYLIQDTRHSHNNVESGYTAYYDSRGNEYSRYQHTWSYTYDMNGRLEGYQFTLNIPQTEMLSGYYSETYKLHY